MKLTKFLPLCLLAVPLMAQGQHIKSGYVDWGIRGTEFPAALEKWEKGQKWTDDDNFFISRVRPHQRFRNVATQVNTALDETNDKKLIFWVPINSPEFNALPDGVYDREVFPMWSYITHYGNWSTSLVRMPGNFIDAAHRNGVPVSVVAGIPWGLIQDNWSNALTKMIEVGPEKMADYLEQYGIDGLGYNSEFQGDSKMVMDLADYHANLVKLLKNTGRMPLCENIWYDGTNESGIISFDQGLGNHNDDLWGYGDNIKTSLFFNYNWNNESLLKKCVRNAAKVNRTTLDLYCGINMQGREPHNSNPTIWPLLQQYPLSIGLWGAHSENMFFESRSERGTAPADNQRTYLLRMERWFTGGSRNPVNTPEISNSLKLEANNYDFFGMSKLMSARSALKWDLSEEPFITNFNLGNGTFFNYNGERCNNNEWYNIGVQDYLPTWMWWFSDSFMGREPGNVPAGGLDAEFVWDDAWKGGSLVRIHGSSDSEYLHLFKTEFGLKRGDVITVRYKVLEGQSNIFLSLSAKGKESTPLAEEKLKVMDWQWPMRGFWRTATFTIDDELSELEGKDLAMIALHFRGAYNLDMRLGEISIVRGNETSATPDKPVLEKVELLASNKSGADGKLIWHMPNTKGNDVCYNIDVKTSQFKVYARQEGREPVLMGLTTSWAALVYSAPVDLTVPGARISFGVSALSLDGKNESEIAWSGYFPVSDLYEYSDDVSISRGIINPGMPFTVEYVDPMHENATWEILDADNKVLAKAENTHGIDCDGISEAGTYTLRIIGKEAGEDGKRVDSVRLLESYIQVSEASTGSEPEILSLACDGKTEDIHVPLGADCEITYEGSESDGQLSRGVKVTDAGLGFAYADTGLESGKSFSVSFWFKPETFENRANHLLNIRDKGDSWSQNNWGWFWNVMNPDGTFNAFCIRATEATISYKFEDVRLVPGVWQHLTYTFDFNDIGGVMPGLYINGKKVKLLSYTRGNQTFEGDAMEYERKLYNWRKNNIVAVGGYLHTNGSVRGNFDNLMVWNKAIDEKEALEAMKTPPAGAIPENLIGYFDFEAEPDAEGAFANGGKGTFKAGMCDYVGTEVEGQGKLVMTPAKFCAGCPFVEGSAWTVKSTPSFEIYGSTIRSIEGDARSGKAKVHFPFNGTFDVKLTLTNEYGSDTRILPVRVGTSGVGETVIPEGGKVWPVPFDDTLNIRVGGAGKYTVSLTGVDGRVCFLSEAVSSSGEAITIRPEIPAGMYMLTLTPESGRQETVKVVKK